MQDRDERLMRLAAEALRTPAAQREKYLRAACQQDNELYSELTELVAWEERMGGFMRDPLIAFIDLEGLDRPFKAKQVVSDRFEIIREVGDGGMGVVYEAYDRKRQQRIAIKCAKLGFERLSPELRGALKVRHPNVCLVNEIHTTSSDVGELDFLTMEFLDGETLLTRLSRGKLEEAEALAIARQLCAGLAAAHHSNILHRDLKPSNVILCPTKNHGTRAVITDFGLAADQDGNVDLVGGTPSYMAPELHQKGPASKASDVYALGMMLYEMVAGQKPFSKSAENNGDAPASAAAHKPAVSLPRMWDQAILPCLAPHPEKRPSAEEVLAILDRKPLYRRPGVAVAALVLVSAGALAWGPVEEYFRPADIRLAILPVQSTGDLAQMGERVLQDLTERLTPELKGKPKVGLIPEATAKKKGVASPEQAEKLLQATHALEVKLSRDNDGILVEAAVVDAKTQAHVRDYSGHFAEAELGDLPEGLAGSVSAALHLRRAPGAEQISPAAAGAYHNGLNFLRRDRYSFDEAIAEFQEAARLDPHSPLPLGGLAEAHVAKYHVQKDQKELGVARDYLQSAEKLDPDAPRTGLASASLNIAVGKYPQAVEDCLRVLEVEPGNGEAWLQYGFANEMQRILDKAQDAYRKAIDLDPGYYKPYEYLGALYVYSLGKYEEAEQQFRKEIEAAPQQLDGYGNLGSVLTSQAKYEEAEKVYRSALQVKETPPNLNNLGATLAYQGRDQEALPLYRRAAELQPAKHVYWINIGDSERRLGHANVATPAYRKGLAAASDQLQMNPTSGSIRGYVAYSEARLGQKAQAKLEIGQALQASGNDTQLMLCAILTYEVLGERDLAFKVAAESTAQARKQVEKHPDLAGFRQDSRFKQMMAVNK